MFRQGQLAVQGLAILLGRNEAGISNRGKFFLHHAVQGRAKLMELSLVTQVPSGPIGCAGAGHFARQN